MKNFIILFCFLFITKTFSQSVQGTVRDPFTKRGIPNVTVTIGRNSAITDTLGYYKIDEITSVSSDKQNNDNSIPKEYSLSQNYPNPFNPATIINFSLPKSEFVLLTVYDILGSEIKTLVREFKSPGVHSVRFDAENLSSGIYFYKIITGHYIGVKKMMLLK